MSAATKPDGRQARASRTRLAILDAATRLFGTKGVSASSIDDIALAAGIAKGSVYNSFGSKTDLVSVLITSQAEMLSCLLDEATAGLTGLAERQALVGGLLRTIRDHRDASRFIASEMFRTDRDWVDSIVLWRATIIGRFVRSFCAEFGDEHRVRYELQAAGIVGATVVTGLEWLSFKPTMTFDEVLATVLDNTNLEG